MEYGFLHPTIFILLAIALWRLPNIISAITDFIRVTQQK